MPKFVIKPTEEIYEWWGLEKEGIMTFFNATKTWVDEHAEDIYYEYGILHEFIDGRC